MQNNLINLEAKGERDFEKKPRLRGMATPDLKDSPLQKDFKFSLEEFERKLIIVTVLSLVVVIIGLIGTLLCKSPQLRNMSLLALALNANWLIGFLLSNKVKKEVDRIQYSNLNGQTGFEFLMFFCQIQILLLIGIYLYALVMVREIVIELKEMNMLSVRENGQLWERAYNSMPLQSVQAVLISFSTVQILILIAVLGYLFRIAQNGI